MPCHYAIDPAKRIITTVGSGRVTFAEVDAHQDQLFADLNFNPDFDHIIDMTAVTDFALTASELSQVATRRMFSAKSRIAWVAPSPAVFGMGRVAATHHELSGATAQARVFSSLSEALQWLGHS